MEGEIKKYMRRGDAQEIADIVGCSSQFVRMVLKGERNGTSKKGKQVIEVAYKIAENRAEIMKRKNV